MPTAATQKSDSTKRAAESLRCLVRLLARRAAQEEDEDYVDLEAVQIPEDEAVAESEPEVAAMINVQLLHY